MFKTLHARTAPGTSHQLEMTGTSDQANPHVQQLLRPLLVYTRLTRQPKIEQHSLKSRQSNE